MKVGFIGLGIMGKPMARNIMKAGYEIVVNTHSAETMKDFAALGAETAVNAKEVAEKTDVIITMLPNSPQVREVCLGEGGIIEGAAENTVVIDMSSIDPTESRAIAAEFAKRGIEMLDCPVSGGEPKAIDGTLSVMCGGKKEIWEKNVELLKTMASSVVYVGPIGSGNVAKLANQMIVAANIGAVAEALTFAKKAGTDPELVYQAIRGGLAGSTVLDAKAPMMLSGNYNPGFRIELHVKDLNNALNASHAINMPVPMTAHMMEVMQELMNHGEGGCDHDDIVRYYERMTGVSLVKK
ncbi:MAG: 2-hydroxy-3-oxopropionate reductase [Eubacterium sp.]|nr:2-hydroxy-3-oxopropionate reductase [Eubacterium sp.]